MCGFVFFKQKTAYDVRISDWSSDVCSSDLRLTVLLHVRLVEQHYLPVEGFELVLDDHWNFVRGLLLFPHLRFVDAALAVDHLERDLIPLEVARSGEIGRASCRERVCQSV